MESSSSISSIIPPEVPPHDWRLQEALERDMDVLRDMMESHDMLLNTAWHTQEGNREKADHIPRKTRSNFDDDDARSMVTVTGGELERIDKDEDHLEQENQRHREAEIKDQDVETEEEKHRRREELGRLRKPEPYAERLPSLRSLSPTQKEKIIPSPTDFQSYRSKCALCWPSSPD